MPTYAIAYNGRSGQYELHAPQCAHVKMGQGTNPHTRKYEYATPVEAHSAQAAAASFAAGNDGCWIDKIFPCAKPST